MNSNAIKIRMEARQRGITALYHFTPMANLESILTHGLHSRIALDASEARYTYTDGWRTDEQLGAVSVSITDPGWAMFQAKIREAPGCRWVILELEPEILWTHDCRFCWDNAARAEIRDYRRYLGGPWGFSNMFADEAMSAIDDRSRRKVLEKSYNQTTRNAAEVQVFTPIGPDQIRDLTVASEREARAIEAWMAENDRVRPVEVYPDAFVV